MSQLEHHLSRWLETAFPPASYALDSRVSCLSHHLSLVLVLIHFLSGGDKGSGSEWFYDGGKLVRRSMMIGKPVIIVTCK